MVPTVKTWSSIACALTDRLYGCVHASAGRHDLISESTDYRGQQLSVLHAVSAASRLAFDGFVENVEGVDGERVVERVVQLEILPRYCCYLEADERGEQRQSLGWICCRSIS